jgi:hypothetical protein
MISDLRVSAIVRKLPETSFTRQFIRYGYTISDAPLAYFLAAGLVLQASVVPRSLTYGPTWHPNLFALIVGSSGSRKTTAADVAIDLLSAVDSSRVMLPPESRSAMVEQIARLPEPVGLYYYPEGGDLFAKLKAPAYASLETSYIALRDCNRLAKAKATGAGTHKVDEKDAIQDILDPRMSLLVPIADEFVKSHTTTSQWQNGFIGRFFCLAATRERHRVMPGFDPVRRSDLLDRLRDMIVPVELHNGRGIDSFTDDAWNYFAEWSTRMDEIGRDAATPSLLQSNVGRVGDLAARIALLLCRDYGSAATDADWQISMAEIVPAIEIAMLHWESLIWLRSVIPANLVEQQRAIVWAVFRAAGTDPLPLGEVLKRTNPKLSKRQLREVLENLLCEGEIEIVNGDQYRRPSD